jgi:7-carboxy-7-deazaguanine synthase
MFGDNEIVGKSFFSGAKSNELLVTSRFFTLQGEGPYSGYPAYFIRLSKCNLACSFCDTSFDSGEWYTFTELFAQANAVINDFFSQRQLSTPDWATALPRKIVLVITGGEPSLQPNLADFLKEAKQYFQIIQIESNGICALSNLPPTTTLVVSPKCLEKNGEVIRFLEPNKKILERADALKFVMSSPDDTRYQVYSEVPKWAHEWASQTGKPLFVSPMNIYNQDPSALTKTGQASKLNLAQRSEINEVVSFWEPGLLNLQKNKRNHEYAAEYCLKYGFILNLQIHLFASLP